MPIDPIKIPQNVYIEDRVVGPLTLKQIITVAIGCGFSYALYASLVKSYGSLALPITVMVWIPGMLSFVFAFIKINDLSLLRLLLLMMERINKPSVRVWAPRRGITINIRTFSTADKTKRDKKHPASEHIENKIDQIHELSAMLDQEAADKSDDLSSPLEEEVEEAPVTPPAPRSVDRSKVVASPMQGGSIETITPPKNGSVSIFRDISPKHT